MADTNIGVTDPDEVIVFVGGIRVVGWPTDGTTFWSPARNTPDNVSAVEGVDGNVSLFRKRNNLIVGTLSIMRTSSSLTALQEFCEQRSVAPTRQSFFPLTVTHLESSYGTATAFVKAFPPSAPAGGEVVLTYEFWMPNATGKMFTLSILPPGQ